jgi:hypothetical protein
MLKCRGSSRKSHVSSSSFYWNITQPESKNIIKCDKNCQRCSTHRNYWQTVQCVFLYTEVETINKVEPF